MCYWEGESPEFLRETWINKARKEYRCYECGKPIKPGDRYRLIAGKWNGSFDQYRQCNLCGRICEDLVDMGFCPNYGELWEFIQEEFEQPEQEEHDV